ncbi:MAG: heme exporter protein CcmB [Actinomycetes bacterium]
MLRDALLVAGRDLRIEARSKVALWQVVPFSVLAMILFTFALGPNPAALTVSAPGFFWIALLFASILATQRSLSIEGSQATRESTRLLGLDPAGVFLGKVGALVAELVVIETILVGGTVLLYHVAFRNWLLLVASCALAAIGLASASVLYGSLAGGDRVRSTLLPILVLPVVAPVLIAGSRAFVAAIGSSGDGGRWVAVLAVFAIVYSVLGIVLYGPMEEI